MKINVEGTLWRWVSVYAFELNRGAEALTASNEHFSVESAFDELKLSAEGLTCIFKTSVLNEVIIEILHLGRKMTTFC